MATAALCPDPKEAAPQQPGASPVRIVQIVTRLNIGGPATQVLLTTANLRLRGYQTVLVAGSCKEDQGDAACSLSPADRITWIPEMARSLSPWLDLLAVLRIYRLLRRERPAIVHTHTAKAGVLGRTAAYLAGVPAIVHTFHGNSLSEYFSPGWNRLFRMIEKLLARLTDRICVVSPQQAVELSERVRVAPRNKLRVLPLGLNLERELALAPPDVMDGRLTVGWFGRLVPIKGIPLLVSVAEEVVRRTRGIRFLVAGDGPLRGAVDDAMRRLGRDRFCWLGWQQDIAPLLAQCHVLVQTSRNEGTPVALIQGMAAGRPFVSTPVGGIVDMAEMPVDKHCSGARWFQNAVLAEPNPSSFTGALIRLADHPELVRSMGERSRSFAAGRFQATRMLAELDAIYREVMQSKRPDSGGGMAGR